MNWTGSRQRQRFQSKKVFLLNPVRVRRFSSTSSFSRRNKLTHSMKGHASSLTLSNHFSSSKQTFHRLPVFEPGLDKTSSAIKCLRKSMFITFPDLGKVTLVSVELLWVRSRDQDTSKQSRAKNVLLASADICGGGRLHDNPKECLLRTLYSHQRGTKLTREVLSIQ